MKRAPKAKWRRGATREEQLQVAMIDARLRHLRKVAGKLSWERNRITNRAVVRARYKEARQ